MKRWHVYLGLMLSSLLAISLLGTSCSNRSVTNPYEFSDFTRLDIQNAFDVQVTQSATFSVSITSSEALLDYLSVTKSGDTLIVKLSPNHPYTDFVLMRKVLKARITMPVLRGITLSGACKGVVTGFESTNEADIEVAGASSLKLNGIETGDANVLVSGDSQLAGKLTAVNVKMDVTGASQVEIRGTGEDVQLTTSGASKANLEEFANQTMTVTLSGASEATVDTRDHLNVSLSGASRLFFLSNPSFGNTEVLGASTLKHKD